MSKAHKWSEWRVTWLGGKPLFVRNRAVGTDAVEEQTFPLDDVVDRLNRPAPKYWKIGYVTGTKPNYYIAKRRTPSHVIPVYVRVKGE